VPLAFEYRETALHETIADLVRLNRAPVYLVNFSQRAAAEEAQNLLSVEVCTKEEKEALSGKRQAYEDIVWALLNTKEFLFNH